MSIATAASHSLRAVPGYKAPHPGIQIGTYISGDASDEELQFMQQLGVGLAPPNIAGLKVGMAPST